MSTEYKIVEVRLKNYRQYYGSATARLTSEDNRFAAVIGNNGAGKSNLLNAINWCFFHKEPHLQQDEGLPIINIKCIKEAEEESKVEMSVSVILEQGTTKYNITRKLAVVKHKLETGPDGEYRVINLVNAPYSELVPAGFEKIPNLSTSTFQRSDNGGTWEDQTKSHDFDAVVNYILPEELSKFFLLDGEFLEKFFEGQQTINKGVKQISQLNVLQETLNHIRGVKSSGRSNYDDHKINELEDKIKIHEKWLHSIDDNGDEEFADKVIPGSNTAYHKNGEPKESDLKSALAYMERERSDVRKKLYEHGRASNANLHKQKTQLFNSLSGDKERLSKVEKQQRDLLINQSPIIMLSKALKTTIGVVSAEIEKGRLPNRSKIVFANDLLSKECCICGTSLKSGTAARKNVESMRASIRADVDLDLANDLKYANEQSISKMEGIEKMVGENTEEISSLEGRLRRTREELSQIEKQLVDDSDDQYHQLTQQGQRIDRDHSEVQSELVEITGEIRRRRGELKSLRQELYNANVNNEKVAKRLHESRVLEQVHSVLESLCDDLSDEIRKKIQDKTTVYFKKIMWKEGFFDQVQIDKYYRLKLLTVTGFDAIDSLAAGEKLFLAFAFVAALREITGYKFPLVIDSPLGKVAGTPRRLLAKQLPLFLPRSQLVLLVTNTEYLMPLPVDDDNPKLGKSFRDILSEQVKVCESAIELHKANHISKISPYVGGGRVD